MKSVALIAASLFAVTAFAQAPAKKEEPKKDAPKAEVKKEAPKAEAKKDEKKK
jgi:hypothetical protein